MNTFKNIMIIVCALFYVVSFYSFTFAEEVKIPNELLQNIKNCLTCDKGSICQVAVRDNKFFYLINIKDGTFSLIKAIENKGQKFEEIDKNISKYGMEACNEVWVYKGKFTSGFSHWDFDKQYNKD